MGKRRWREGLRRKATYALGMGLGMRTAFERSVRFVIKRQGRRRRRSSNVPNKFEPAKVLPSRDPLRIIDLFLSLFRLKRVRFVNIFTAISP